MNFFVVGLGLIAVAIPAAPFWEGEEHFDFVFGMAPRIVAVQFDGFPCPVHSLMRIVD